MDQTRTSASSLVVDYIREKLISGEWAPGAKIHTENELMQSVGVGRQAVREAIGSLVSLDILSKRQGSGTYVRSLGVDTALNQMIPKIFLDNNDTLAILEFRKIIEPACIRLFIQNADRNSVDEIKGYLETMKKYEFDRTTETFCIADGNFHNTIIKGADNAIIERIMELVNTYFLAYQLKTFETIGPKNGVREHQAIVEAIERRDKDLASLLMLRHIERSEADFKAYIESNTVDS